MIKRKILAMGGGGNSMETDNPPPKCFGGDSLLIRRAAVQDAMGIHHAHMRSIQEICSKDHSPHEIEAWGNRPYREDQRISAIKNDLVWVIEDHGSIEGYGHLKIFEKTLPSSTPG